MPRRVRSAKPPPARRQHKPEHVEVIYADRDDPATADRVVEIFRRLLARAAVRKAAP